MLFYCLSFFFKINLFKKIISEISICGHDMSSNCFQSLSADGTSRLTDHVIPFPHYNIRHAIQGFSYT